MAIYTRGFIFLKNCKGISNSRDINITCVFRIRREGCLFRNLCVVSSQMSHLSYIDPWWVYIELRNWIFLEKYVIHKGSSNRTLSWQCWPAQEGASDPCSSRAVVGTGEIRNYGEDLGWRGEARRMRSRTARRDGHPVLNDLVRLPQPTSQMSTFIR